MMKTKIQKIFKTAWTFIKSFTIIPTLKCKRQQFIIEKQIELIKKADDVSYIKDFLDETPLKKQPFSKIKAAFYTIIVLCILTLLGVNIEPIILLIKPILMY